MQLVTEGVSAWADGVSGNGRDSYLDWYLRGGKARLKAVGIESKSDDLAILAGLVVRGVAALPNQRLDEDYIVAGDVLDQYVTDHDAELLAELEPAIGGRVGEVVGGMTPEATAVHDVLLDVAAWVREKLTQAD